MNDEGNGVNSGGAERAVAPGATGEVVQNMPYQNIL